MKRSPIEVLHDAPAIARRIAELGSKIENDIGREDPLVVCLLGGSVIFLADLLRAIRTPLRFAFIQVELSEDAAAMQAIHYPLPLDIADQSLLVLKDVVGSGVIETYLSNQLKAHGARQVRFAALIDLPSERKTEFRTDYYAFEEKRPSTFVGYGLKHQGRWGSLPQLGRLHETI